LTFCAGLAIRSERAICATDGEAPFAFETQLTTFEGGYSLYAQSGGTSHSIFLGWQPLALSVPAWRDLRVVPDVSYSPHVLNADRKIMSIVGLDLIGDMNVYKAIGAELFVGADVWNFKSTFLKLGLGASYSLGTSTDEGKSLASFLRFDRVFARFGWVRSDVSSNTVLVGLNFILR
jgi:hypothetical protein